MNYVRAIPHALNLAPYVMWHGAGRRWLQGVRSHTAVASTSRRGGASGPKYLGGRRTRRRRRPGRRGRPSRMRRTSRRMSGLRGVPHAPKAMYERRTHVSENSYINVTNGFNGDLVLNISGSMLTYFPGYGSLTTCADTTGANARVPYFWRQLDQWKSFTIVGLKLKVFTYPKYYEQELSYSGVTTGAAALTTNEKVWKYDDAWSVTGEVNSTLAPTWTVHNQNDPVRQYTCRDEANRDPTYRGAVFFTGRTSAGAPTSRSRAMKKLVFARYYPLTHDVKAHEGMNSMTSCPAVDEDDCTEQIRRPPVLGLHQRDSFLQYCVNALRVGVGLATTSLTHEQYHVRRTWYVHFYGRKVEHVKEWPAWQRPTCLVGADYTDPTGPCPPAFGTGETELGACLTDAVLPPCASVCLEAT